MIDREQVLHVARLARLELADEEVDRMARELSGILDHVDNISALDLEDVEPTSHVVALENVFRADEPEPSLPRERALGALVECLEDPYAEVREAAGKALRRLTGEDLPAEPEPWRAHLKAVAPL